MYLYRIRRKQFVSFSECFLCHGKVTNVESFRNFNFSSYEHVKSRFLFAVMDAGRTKYISRDINFELNQNADFEIGSKANSREISVFKMAITFKTLEERGNWHRWKLNQGSHD